MWLTTSDTSENVLVERQLVPESQETLDQATRGLQHAGVQLSPYEIERTMPVVKINKYEPWTLQNFCAPAQLPRPIRTKLREADFYVVRFTCSFSPIPKQSCIEWARFRVTLLPPTGAQPSAFDPYAFDLYPKQVIQGVKRHVRVTVSPSLTFKELEASAGNADFGIEYDELLPSIRGDLGDDSVDPSWDFRPVPGQEVEGPKELFLLVKAPKGMTGAQARLNIVAKVRVRGVLIRGILWRPEEQADQRTVSLWS
jgi:hypothetical protein